MRYEIRELNVGGILDQAIKLTKDNFWLFLKIALVLLVPFHLVSGILMQWTAPDFSQMRQPGMVAPGAEAGFTMPVGFMVVFGLSMLINLLVVGPLTDASMIYAISNTYLEKPISVGSAFSRAFRIYVPLLGTWILMSLAISAPIIVGVFATWMLGPIGFLVILIMAVFSIIFVFWFMLATRIVVIEGVAGPAALSRSKRLMKGNAGTLFTLLFLMGIVFWLIGAAANFISQPQLAVVVQTILQSILEIFAAAALVVFYFSCRCKAENFDLTMLADAVAADDAPVQNLGTV